MTTHHPFHRQFAAAVAVGAAAIGLLAASATAKAPPKAKANKPPAHAAKTLWVSPKGAKSAKCTKKDPCGTIAAAITKAGPGATVMVERGVYREEAMIVKRVRLVGLHMPTIEAKGMENGIKIAGAGAAGSTVKGFLVEHATFEGILALSTSKVTIAGNTVRENDLGAHAAKPEGECAPQGVIPGDCGEGVHLMGVTSSKVMGNVVTGNTGGILLTDETGPTARNLIAHNRVVGNLYDCGITLAGHNPKAVSSAGPQPKVAGVYDNRIFENVSNGNGVKGEGAGILMAGGAPGTGVYGNLVKGNTADGNGLAGITVHSHAPGQDLNGNRIMDNKVSHDALTGSKGKPGDEDAGVGATTGILVFSAVSTLKGTVISGNTISDVHFGIWTKNVPKIKPRTNRFVKVALPLTQM